MSCAWKWEGLEELRAALRTLPADLAGEAYHIVDGTVNAAAGEIKAGYPPGELQDKLDWDTTTDGFGVRGIIQNTSPIAWLFEHGTQARHTALGLNRGAAPAAHVFVPAIVRQRLKMYDALKAMLERHGLVVSGEAED